MRLRNDSLERRKKVFRLYQKAKRTEAMALNFRAEGRSAIAVSNDEYAIQWQSVQMRLNIMECYLSGTLTPNWFNARWLSHDEARKRNDSYWD